MKARWKVLAASAALALAVTACGEDKGKSSTEDPSGGSDSGANGTGNGGTAGNGNGNSNSGGNDGDGGWTPPPPLEPGVVGKACATDEDCGEGGSCEDNLRGGRYGDESLGGGAAPGGYCTRTCTEDADCGDGVCFGNNGRGGECRKKCGGDTDCGREGYECAKLNNPPLTDDTGATIDVPTTCQAKREPIVSYTNQVANACTSDAECGGNGTCRTGQQFPGGYCSGYCNSNADCGQEGYCLLRTYGTGGSCYESCAVDTDCKRDTMNYGCVDVDDTGATKICYFEMDPLTDGVVGKACTEATEATDCGNGVCAQRVGTMQVPTPGGYCSQTGCDEDIECGTGGVCATSQGGSRCYKSCTTTADCRTGYECTVYGTNMKNVCFPIAVAGDAGTGP